MMHSLASFPMKTRQAEASLSPLSSFPVDIFICLSMGCAPSLAHYWNYSFTAMGDEVRRVARASRCLSFCDFFGAHPGNGRDSPGLFAISHNLNRGYQKTCATYQGKMASEQVSMMMHGPDHLLVLVHGILASPSDWTYAETELKKKLGSTFLIYASSSNSYAKTFSGIDGAGRRLADEVLNVVKNTESLRKISFLAHSLGGLFARYAIGVLYSSNTPDASPDENLSNSENWSPDKSQCSSKFGKIAGLEPINFITLATPHLGVRGRKQLPFLLGVPVLEKLAAPLAPIFTGQTGRQLFLTDGKPDKPPLLLRMTSDHENMKFISALTAFRSRVLYANVSYDRIHHICYP
ncbi:hypothetical protein AXF42_Ash003017 [Apostasia shenzhenica]|uniref:DUF676 domain-containing protein n=1 Tax=Apostasia shenzhenica TaxID=1088818 RepID=A0A2I0A7W5_9ASPA|nr:hypothetical protein AXF42_Ash003017 [Apostasia shenzhenica]